MTRWRESYGAGPLHLLSLLACFALAGWAGLQASHGPLPLRMGVWFVGALVAHDLVLFPLYALLDRVLVRTRRPAGPSGAVNWVRVPALLSGALLLVSLPLVTRHSEGAYGRASGLTEAPYLGRWLLLTAVLFGGSAALFVLRAVVRQGRSTSKVPPSPGTVSRSSP